MVSTNTISIAQKNKVRQCVPWGGDGLAVPGSIPQGASSFSKDFVKVDAFAGLHPQRHLFNSIRQVVELRGLRN